MTKVIKIENLTNQSTFTTLETRKRFVNIRTEGMGKTAIRYGLEVTIPDWFPSDKDFNSFDGIIDHLKKFNADLPLAVLQSGIVQELIQVWTKPKPKPPKQDGTGGENIHSDGYAEKAITRTFEYMPTVMERPNQADTKTVDKARYADCLNMFAQLTTAGMNRDTIIEMSTKIYGYELVQTVIKTITE